MVLVCVLSQNTTLSDTRTSVWGFSAKAGLDYVATAESRANQRLSTLAFIKESGFFPLTQLEVNY